MNYYQEPEPQDPFARGCSIIFAIIVLLIIIGGAIGGGGSSTRSDGYSTDLFERTFEKLDDGKPLDKHEAQLIHDLLNYDK